MMKVDPNLVEKLNAFWQVQLTHLRENCVKLDMPFDQYKTKDMIYIIWTLNKIDEIIGRDSLSSVVELGCGKGATLVYANKNFGAKSLGLDISETALTCLEELATHEGAEVETKLGDIFHTGFADDEFTLSYNVGVFEHLPFDEQLQLLREMARISKYVLVQVPNEDSPAWKQIESGYAKHRGSPLFYPEEDTQFKVDLAELFTEAGLVLKAHGGMCVLPLFPDAGYLDDEAIIFYNQLFQNGIPQIITQSDVMNFLENENTTAGQRLLYSSRRYALGYNPNHEMNN